MPRPRKPAPPQELTLDSLPDRQRGLIRLVNGTYKVEFCWKVQRTGPPFRAAIEGRNLLTVSAKLAEKLKAFDALEAGKVDVCGRVRLRDFVDKCAQVYWKEELRPNPLRNNVSNLRNFILNPLPEVNGMSSPGYGDWYLDAITEDDLRKPLDYMRDVLERDDHTRANVRTALSKVYSTARAKGVVPKDYNPVQGIAINRNRRRFGVDGQRIEHFRVVTPAQQDALLSWARSHWCEAGLWMGLHLGLRRGEILGAQWADIAWERRMIHIQRQIKREYGKGLVVTDLKVEGKDRWVPISANLYTYLLQEHERQAAIPGRKRKPLWIIENTDEEHENPEELHQALIDLTMLADLTNQVDDYGRPLPEISWHDLRHTLAMELADAGVPMHSLAAILGDTIETVSRYYVHAQDAKLHEAIQRLDLRRAA